MPCDRICLEYPNQESSLILSRLPDHLQRWFQETCRSQTQGQTERSLGDQEGKGGRRMVRKAKSPGSVRVLDKHDDRSISEDQRSSRDDSETTDLRSSQTKSQSSGSEETKTKEAIEVDLGLDISSSITGVVLMDKNGVMLFMGHVPLTSVKYKTIFDKADAVIDWIKDNVSDQFKVRRIFVEANAKGYSVGFSSADTLFTLAKMNALVSYLTHKWFGVPVIDVNVTSARSKIGYKNNKSVKKPVKEKVREFVLLNHPYLPFQTRTVTVGKNKGMVVPATGVEDEIDAFILCLGGQLMYPL